MPITVGSFAKDSSGVNDAIDTISGLEERPKAIIIQINSKVAVGATAEDVRFCQGIVDENNNQRSSSTFGGHNLGTTVELSRCDNTHALQLIDSSGVVTDSGIVEITNDGFKIQWDVNSANGYFIIYTAIMGDVQSEIKDIVIATTDSIEDRTETTTLDMAGVNDEEALLYCITSGTENINATENGAVFFCGAGTSEANQWFLGFNAEAAQSTSDTTRFQNNQIASPSNKCIERAKQTGVRSNAGNWRFKNWTTNGLVISVTELPNDHDWTTFCLIIKGGEWHADEFTTGTEAQGADVSLTGVGFTPELAGIFSVHHTAGSAVTARIAAGWGDSELNQAGMGLADNDNLATTECGLAFDNTHWKFDTTKNLDGERWTLLSMDPDGLTYDITMKANGTRDNQILYGRTDPEPNVKKHAGRPTWRRRFWPQQNIIKIPHIFNFSLVPKAPLQKKIIREKIVSSVVSMPVIKQVVQMVSPRLSVTLKEHAEEQKTVTVPTNRVHSEQHSITITITKSHLMTAVLRYQDTLITNDPLIDAIILGDDVALADALEEGDGVWRTINGTPVFIREGESVDEAMDRAFQGKSPKTPSPKSNRPRQTKDYQEVSKQFREFDSQTSKQAYSYDPTTGKAFDAMKDTDSVKKFHSEFSEDGKPVYVIGVTNHQGGLGRRTQSAYSDVKGKGDFPLIGKWTDSNTGFEYTDVSFPRSGISDSQAKGLGNQFGQEAVMKISANGEVEFL